MKSMSWPVVAATAEKIADLAVKTLVLAANIGEDGKNVFRG
jgi:hypothetical protein